MILHDYVRLLVRRWWVIAIFALAGAGVAAALTYTTSPTYYTQATLHVTIGGSDSPGDLQQGNVFAVQRVATYAGLATTDAVLDRAASALGGDTDADDLRGVISASGREQTALLDISATGSDPAVVTAQANAVAVALASEASLLDASGAASPVLMTVVQSAERPEHPLAPRPRNNLLIGTVVGLLLGVGSVVVADALNTRIRTLRDLPRTPAVDTVTSIPTALRRFARPATSDIRLESFRNLRADLQFGGDVGGSLALAGVSSASDVHGVGRQLAVAFGETRSRVVVVDLDFRPPARRRRRRSPVGAVRPPGLADLLNGTSTLDEVIVHGSAENVSELPAGNVDPASAQLLSTPTMRQLLDELTARYDFVLLVSPPLVERSESAVAAAMAAGSLVIVESGATKRSEFLLALERLAGVGVKSINVAIDHIRPADLGVTSSWVTEGPVAT